MCYSTELKRFNTRFELLKFYPLRTDCNYKPNPPPKKSKSTLILVTEYLLLLSSGLRYASLHSHTDVESMHTSAQSLVLNV